MGGIESWKDALEFLMMGAGSIQVTTAIMQYGYRIIDDLKKGLLLYLTEKGFSSVKDVVGIGLDSISDTTDILERDTIIYPKFHLKKCVGCGRCVISCADGGHQAISMAEVPAAKSPSEAEGCQAGNAISLRRPRLDPRKCVGCHLCVLVCPQRAITSSGRRIRRIE
jgi:dihydropyrimidine dehydrogenase (NAD+) subunit PreA